MIFYLQVLDFYGRHPDIVADVKDLIKNKIDSNIHWMDRNLDVITTWLETNAQQHGWPDGTFVKDERFY